MRAREQFPTRAAWCCTFGRVLAEHPQVSGNYGGHDEIRDFFIHLATVTGGSMRLEVLDTLADDDHA